MTRPDEFTPPTPTDPSTLSSEAIQVQEFEQILWLPLRLSTSFTGNEDWAEEKIDSPSGSEAAYAEYLYFHPTIRTFLWGEGSHAHIRRWKRSSPEQFLDLLLPKGQESPLKASKPPFVIRLEITECQFFTFGADDHIGLLQVHWKTAPVQGVKPTLAEVLDLLDCARRTHPGYFPFEHGEALNLIGGRVPISAHLHSIPDAPITLTYDKAALEKRKAESLQAVEQHRTPMFPYWEKMLGTQLKAAANQIEDERMPYMAYVAVKDPTQISPGDWVRLTFADYRGDSSKFPYAHNYLPDFSKKYCYDRYFDPANGWTTRILNCGYAFTMVGSSSHDFFTHDARDHFQRHYAKIGLLLQYNKAALLNFSKELADASHSDSGMYSKAVRGILSRLVRFTHKHWFEGFTNQTQGQELSAQWSEHLGLSALYQSVMNEAQLAHAQVLSEEEKSQTDAIVNLTHWGLLLAGLGLLLALAGAGFPFGSPFAIWNAANEVSCLTGDITCTWKWSQFLAVSVPYVFLGAIGYWLLKKYAISPSRRAAGREDDQT
jgi:hypothetical protein